MVQQEPIVFSGTIVENIAYGRPGATREEIVRDCSTADLYDFVQSLPLPCDTVGTDCGARILPEDMPATGRDMTATDEQASFDKTLWNCSEK